MFKVFQIHLTDQQSDEVNEKGWGCAPWADTYLDLTRLGMKNSDNASIMKMINDAIDFGLVTHTMDIYCENLNEAYAAGNGMHDSVEVVHHKRHKSMSVGDILIQSDSKAGAVVKCFGFEMLSEFDAKEIEVLVPQKITFEA